MLLETVIGEQDAGNDMKIAALAPWFGAKRNLAQILVKEFGPHRVFWDVMCGSMSPLLAKPPCVLETVNDFHGDLINLARVIQDERLGSQLYRRLRRTLMSEVLHQEAVERCRVNGYGGDMKPNVDRAYEYFLCAWLGRKGLSGTANYNHGFSVHYTANGGRAAIRWASVIESIPAWRRRLRNVTILCKDAFELLARINDEPGCVIYCDPPYLVKGEKYVHDFTEQQHSELAAAVRMFSRARVVVSYYDDPRLDTLYPSWTKRKIEVTKPLANQGRRDKGGAVMATEVLLINGPSLVECSQRELFA